MLFVDRLFMATTSAASRLEWITALNGTVKIMKEIVSVKSPSTRWTRELITQFFDNRRQRLSNNGLTLTQTPNRGSTIPEAHIVNNVEVIQESNVQLHEQQPVVAIPIDHTDTILKIAIMSLIIILFALIHWSLIILIIGMFFFCKWIISLRNQLPRRASPFSIITIIIFVVLYVLGPIDLLPDFIPVVGWIDDIVVICIGILFILSLKK